MMPRALSTNRYQTPRPLYLMCLAVLIALLASTVAHLLHVLIASITQLMFFGQFSHEWTSAEGHRLGVWVILIPALGGGLIALMARYGSKGILGHGIPEVMQQILVNRSRISPKVAILKPLSSAVSIGTGSPYGAEGPVIATGSALGSLIGQCLTVTASERKILLSAGAAAAMTAIFGSPVAATLLAVELLLFEFSPRAVLPVAVSAAVAQIIRIALGEHTALFQVDAQLDVLGPISFFSFIAIGLCSGVLAVGVNRAVHGAEDLFAKLPVHWMWRPVLGGLAVGIIGWWQPRVFGAGYGVIEDLLAGELALTLVGVLCGLKLVAWVISLGSGTSGGTLAPMLIAGGGLGVLVSAALDQAGLPAPAPGLAALAGMVAFFASGSRAFFASIILGVEITQEAGVLWPITISAVVGVATAHTLSRRSIMSSPVEQKGIRVPTEFSVDIFSHLTVDQVMERNPLTVSATTLIGTLADRVGSGERGARLHSALLVTDEAGQLSGVITRKDILTAIELDKADEPVGSAMSHPPVCVYSDELLHEALERMHMCGVGRLPVVSRTDPKELLGYLGRAAILSARRVHWEQEHHLEDGWISRGTN